LVSARSLQHREQVETSVKDSGSNRYLIENWQALFLGGLNGGNSFFWASPG
jgi:hypothetical protein